MFYYGEIEYDINASVLRNHFKEDELVFSINLGKVFGNQLFRCTQHKCHLRLCVKLIGTVDMCVRVLTYCFDMGHAFYKRLDSQFVTSTMPSRTSFKKTNQNYVWYTNVKLIVIIYFFK